jgi:type IV secretion system protein VirB10
MSDADLPRDAEPSARTTAASPVMDRTISPVAGRFGAGRTGKLVTVAALAVGCGIFMYATYRHGPAKPKTPLQAASQVVAFEPAKTDPATGGPAVPTLANPGGNAPVLDPNQQNVTSQVPALQPGAAGSQGASAASAAQASAQARAAKLQAIRGAPILAFSQNQGGFGGVATSLQPVAGSAQAPAHTPTELDQLRQGSAIGLAQASRLPDRNFLITAGTSIPCTLQTAMDTSTPGYVSCIIPSDVYSDNGAVVLMEKGTKVLGEYRSGMHQGQKRLFVLWTRAVTPAGVAIGLASPASDALGRAGFDGRIDTHFWERFGGALLLSIVDDTASAVASSHDPNGEVTRVPSDAAGIALQNSINIPPTLTKPQGAQVAIFAAQDFDFSGVYALRGR